MFEQMQADDRSLQAEEPFSLIGEIDTGFDAVRVLRRVCADFGFLYFSVMTIPSLGASRETSIARLSTFSSLPAELMTEYDRLAIDGGETIFKRLHGRLAPLVYSMQDRVESDPADRLLSQFGISGGVYFPVHDARGDLHVVSLHGNRAAPTIAEMSRLGLFSTLLVERLAVVSADMRSPARISLTPRETEVLRWTAEGKTSGEIAIITSLSEHTVNHYVTLATQKLGCSNRTQAVVRAIRTGLFS